MSKKQRVSRISFNLTTDSLSCSPVADVRLSNFRPHILHARPTTKSIESFERIVSGACFREQHGNNMGFDGIQWDLMGLMGYMML